MVSGKEDSGFLPIMRYRVSTKKISGEEVCYQYQLGGSGRGDENTPAGDYSINTQAKKL
jgi:hypothetical protein